MPGTSSDLITIQAMRFKYWLFCGLLHSRNCLTFSTGRICTNSQVSQSIKDQMESFWTICILHNWGNRSRFESFIRVLQWGTLRSFLWASFKKPKYWDTLCTCNQLTFHTNEWKLEPICTEAFGYQKTKEGSNLYSTSKNPQKRALSRNFCWTRLLA